MAICRDAKKALSYQLFMILAIILLLYTALAKPSRTGDGWQYMLMSVSFANHHSCELTNNDLSYAYKEIAVKNNIQDRFGSRYFRHKKPGYYKALNNQSYSYHFWFYSLLASLFIPLFSFLKLNLLGIFQFTNSILLILLMYWINFRAQLTPKQKFWLAFITLLGPTWYYLKWTHPEIFSFVLLYISLLEFRDNHKISACLFSSLASLQNPAIGLFPLFVIVQTLMQKKKIDKSILFMSGASAISIIPCIFYYRHFRVFSLIAKHAIRYDLLSLNRMLSLFFDLNFGMIIFIPMILLAAIFLCLKKDKKCLGAVFLLLAMALVCSAQGNWNSGMQYIHRYAFWMMPFLFLATMDYFTSFAKKKFMIIASVFLFTTTIPCLIYRIIDYNYLAFSPQALLVLNLRPSWYNPEYEVFAQRTTHKIGKIKFPVVYESKTFGVRKMLVKDENTGLVGYLNNDDLFVRKESKKPVVEQARDD
jgi:hypothetical protein